MTMLKNKKSSNYLLIFLLLLVFFSLTPAVVFCGEVTPNILIHVGKTGYKTRSPDQNIRTDFSQIGYDLKLKYKLKDFVPFVIVDGHKTFTDKSDQISASYRFGFGSYYLINPNNRLHLDMTWARDRILMKVNNQIHDTSYNLYKIELGGEFKLFSVKNNIAQALIGVGINCSTDKKIFKFERGEYTMAGLRYRMPDKVSEDEFIVLDIYWERDAIRSAYLKQERNSLIFRAGKEF